VKGVCANENALGEGGHHWAPKVVPFLTVTHTPGEGFLRTEGALADDPEWDSIMEEIHQARKVERRPQGDLE
jgi:hypothetical protein